MRKKVLRDLKSGKITVNEAYYKLYGHKPNRGSFVKLKINVLESRGVSAFLNVIFSLPIPIVIAKPFIIKLLRKDGLSEAIYYDVVRYSGGTEISVVNDEVEVYIKII